MTFSLVITQEWLTHLRISAAAIDLDEEDAFETDGEQLPPTNHSPPTNPFAGHGVRV